MIGNLKKSYGLKKSIIKTRLSEFKENWNKNDEEVFAELCFCLLTPQSRAVLCDASIKNLVSSGELFTADIHIIEPKLNCRFPKNKSKYIIEARKMFSENGKMKIKSKIDVHNPYIAREWLVENVKGLGYKEASHFLRNIGFGRDLAILDVHVLKTLKKFEVIKEIPKTLTKKKYLEAESKMKIFSKRVGIPMDELDLLLWSEETGEIFK